MTPPRNSGDATLAVFDLRQNKLEGQVTNQEDELLSIQILKVKRWPGAIMLWVSFFKVHIALRPATLEVFVFL